MSNKTVEEGYKDWMKTSSKVDLHSFYAAFAAGAAHGAAEERRKTEAIIAVIRDEYGGHAVDAFVDDLHKRLKRERRIRQRGEK